MKKIVVYKGDEYRPKIEKEFGEDAFFSEVYERATLILQEITTEMGTAISERPNIGRKLYLGNNVILFCGERGQGKTTAMNSFAEQLKSNDAFGNVYEILTSIDPSALESGESILRVLISRLFYQLEEMIKKNSEKIFNDLDFKTHREEIVELFEKCFTNIDYIQAGKGADGFQEGLEVLAQLGNSSQLKKNLSRLIDEYLCICGLFSEKKPQYLVIQIDDADLATKKIFKVCEEVRNYLSIPKVIIFMAADYTQLTYAIYQKYLSKFKSLKSGQDEIDVSGECYKMATRYMEKVFPVGHRIELPLITEFLAENHNTLCFNYVEILEQERYTKFSEELKEGSDLQEQLLTLLYNRTGIVFLKNKLSIHPFLPKTVRELTHFIKMLDDMKPVKWEDEKVDWKNIRRNLSMIKQYFFYYWCAKNLTAAEKQLVTKIDSANQKRDNEKVIRNIRKYYKKFLVDKSGKNDLEWQIGQSVTYRRLLHDVIENKLSTFVELQQALYIYYTIFLNEWFAMAVDSEDDRVAFSEFLETPFSYEGNWIRKKYAEKYNVFDFKIDKGRIDLEEVKQSQNTVGWSLFFPQIFNEQKENVEEALEFDAFYPILTAWCYQFIKKEVTNEQTVPIESVDSSDIEVKRLKEEVQSVNMDEAIVYIKNIVTNYDVQKSIEKKLESMNTSKDKSQEPKKTWATLLLESYDAIDSWANGLVYVNSNLKVIFENYITNNVLLANVFLANSDNRIKYIEKYNSELSGFVSNLNVYSDNLLNLSKTDIASALKNVESIKQWTPSNELKIINLTSIKNGKGEFALEELNELDACERSLVSYETELMQKGELMIELLQKDGTEKEVEMIQKEIQVIKSNLSKKIS